MVVGWFRMEHPQKSEWFRGTRYTMTWEASWSLPYGSLSNWRCPQIWKCPRIIQNWWLPMKQDQWFGVPIVEGTPKMDMNPGKVTCLRTWWLSRFTRDFWGAVACFQTNSQECEVTAGAHTYMCAYPNHYIIFRSNSVGLPCRHHFSHVVKRSSNRAPLSGGVNFPLSKDWSNSHPKMAEPFRNGLTGRWVAKPFRLMKEYHSSRIQVKDCGVCLKIGHSRFFSVTYCQYSNPVHCILA